MWIWDVPSPSQLFSSCSDKTLSSLPGLPVHKKYYSFILNDTSDQFRVGLCHKPDWNKTNKKIFNYLLLPPTVEPLIMLWVIDLSPSHSLTASSRPKLQWQNVSAWAICRWKLLFIHLKWYIGPFRVSLWHKPDWNKTNKILPAHVICTCSFTEQTTSSASFKNTIEKGVKRKVG